MIWLKQEYDFQSGAILNFNKPVGKSSFWIVKKVRYLIDTKVGHAGTLDPFAEGVLLLCTGKATKQVSALMILPKEYVGVIRLGVQTETDDPTGEIVEQHEVGEISSTQVEEALREFIGEIYQIPPMYSAKKVGGERLYRLARKGQVIEREPMLVNISNIELLVFNGIDIKVRVHCSKGTYIRALARDVGKKLGCGAHLKSLVRTKIGDYTIEDSLDLEKFNQLLDARSE